MPNVAISWQDLSTLSMSNDWNCGKTCPTLSHHPALTTSEEKGCLSIRVKMQNALFKDHSELAVEQEWILQYSSMQRNFDPYHNILKCAMVAPDLITKTLVSSFLSYRPTTSFFRSGCGTRCIAIRTGQVSTNKDMTIWPVSWQKAHPSSSLSQCHRPDIFQPCTPY